jgi:SAM-dependent methyltransferase
LNAELQHLPFRDGSFDCVSSVTVVQHIPPAQQRRALEEMVRVLRPGGYLILFELIRGEMDHVFSRRSAGWIASMTSLGPELINWFGQEFVIFDRLFVTAIQSLRRFGANPLPSSHRDSLASDRANSKRMSVSRRIYWTCRKVLMTCSAAIEPVAERICPADLATHGVFIFRKPNPSK